MDKLKIKYARISNALQQSARQEINKEKYDKILVDKISGTIPFFERPMGKLIYQMTEENRLDTLYIHSVDRLGRNLLSTLSTIEYFNKRNVPIHIENMQLITMVNGKINPTVSALVQLHGIFAEFENVIRAERQAEGIAIAKLKNKYNGRAKNSQEDALRFLSKPKNKRALELLKTGELSSREISKAVGLHYNTIRKIKTVGTVQS